MNIAQLILELRYRWNDEKDLSYPEDMLLSFVNEALVAFTILTGCNQEMVIKNKTHFDTSFRLDLNTILAGNATKVMVRKITNLTDLQDISWAPSYEFKRTQTIGETTSYTVWGEQLLLDRLPSDEVEIWLVTSPDTVTISSELPIPQQWYPAIIDYAEYRIRAREREGGLADRAYEEFINIGKVARTIYGAEIEAGGE